MDLEIVSKSSTELQGAKHQAMGAQGGGSWGDPGDKEVAAKVTQHEKKELSRIPEQFLPLCIKPCVPYILCGANN